MEAGARKCSLTRGPKFLSAAVPVAILLSDCGTTSSASEMTNGSFITPDENVERMFSTSSSSLRIRNALSCEFLQYFHFQFQTFFS